MEKRDAITYVAETDVRGTRRRFGIKTSDRTRHVYVIGKPGTGKSTLLAHMALQDIERGDGLIFFDPEGSVVRTVFSHLPEKRRAGIMRVSLREGERVPSCNILAHVDRDKRNIIVAGILRACERNFGDAWDERVSLLLENALFALLEYRGATLLDAGRMVSDAEFRAAVAASITDTQTKMFWTVEFPRYTDHDTREAVGVITQKLGALFAHPEVRTMFGSPHSEIDLDRLTAHPGVVLIDLSSGAVSKEVAAFVGTLLITKVHAAMLARSEIPPAALAQTPPLFVYADGFPLYTGDTFGDLIADARRSKVGLVLAHQFVEEMPRAVRDAIFGHVGTLAVFHVGSFDADIFEKEFAPQITAEHISELGSGEMYIRLMIDGVGSKPFWAVGLPPLSATIPTDAKGARETAERDRFREKKSVPPPRTSETSQQALGGRKEVRASAPTPPRAQTEERKSIPPVAPKAPVALSPNAAGELDGEGEDDGFVSLADLLKQAKEERGGQTPGAAALPPAAASQPSPTPPDAKPAEISEDVLKSVLE